MTIPPNLNRPMAKRDAQGNVITPSFGDMTFRGDYTGTNLIYKGFARPGASEGALVWQIAKLAYDGSSNLLSILWPENSFSEPSSEYLFSWTARASYTYA